MIYYFSPNNENLYPRDSSFSSYLNLFPMRRFFCFGDNNVLKQIVFLRMKYSDKNRAQFRKTILE